LLKTLLIILDPNLIDSDASHLFVKIKQKLCANTVCQKKGSLNNFNV